MPIALRSDFDATTLRRLARRTRDSAQARRLLALAVIHDGGSRAQAAETGGVCACVADRHLWNTVQLRRTKADHIWVTMGTLPGGC